MAIPAVDGRHPPDQSTLYAQQLNSCRDLSQVRIVHSQIRDGGLGGSRFLANQLVKMYGKCGSVPEALAAFQSIRDPNIYSWNLVISAHARNGRLDDARALLDRMPQRSVVAINSMLTSYARRGSIDQARELFDSMREEERDVISWTAMVAAYAQNGHIHDARLVFDRMPERNLVSWNSMIAGYAHAVLPIDAKRLFDRMPRRDLVSWTAMITAFARVGHGRDAIATFARMDLDGFQPDAVSFAAAIDSCGDHDLAAGRIIHAEILASGVTDAVIRSALVAMYARCFQVEEARRVFDLAREKKEDLPWNAMIVAYAQSGRGRDAIKLFVEMDIEGVPPDAIAFASAFDACASCGAAATQGRIIHAALIDRCSSRSCSSIDPGDDVVVGTALVNMYGKAGFLEESKRVFDAMPGKNVLSVTAMVESFAQAGQWQSSLEVFRSMLVDGFDRPDSISFVSVLAVCSHGGLLAEAWQIFVSMEPDYGVRVKVDHYVCMIDLLGRAGKIDDAGEVINWMPYVPDSASWTSLLSGCATQGEQRSKVAKKAMVLEPHNSGAYKLLVHG